MHVGTPLEKIEKYVFPAKEGSAPKLPQLIISEEQRQAIRSSGKAGMLCCLNAINEQICPCCVLQHMAAE